MTFKLDTRFALAVAVLCSLIALGDAGAQGMSAEAIEGRIGSVQKLLNESSAAGEVQSADSDVANGLRAQALGRYEEAVAAFDAGDNDAATAALNDAVKLMYQAVNEARSDGVVTEKADRDFHNRRDGVDALLSAHQRISAEKGQQAAHDALRSDVESRLKEADALLASGDAEKARVSLDSVYKEVMLSVENLRQGDTLVRELNFETEEDEYLYELDRNDTHRMLVNVLLEERMADPRIRERVTAFVSEADKLRGVAESQAESGDFAQAIESLENATGELVKAIRSAGVYIPG